MNHPSVMLRVVAAAIALSAAASSAQALTASFDFDNVAAGSKANLALGTNSSFMHFANADTVLDEDANGYTGTFHWVDATATFGDVLVSASPYAVSGTNVLANDKQPMLLLFSQAVNLAQFSIQQDTSNLGNPQANGTRLSFLDATGHVIAGASVAYTQYAQPGFTIVSGAVSNVSGILFAGGKDYDNLSLTATSVPEPSTLLLVFAGLGVMGLLTRRGHRSP